MSKENEKKIDLDFEVCMDNRVWTIVKENKKSTFLSTKNFNKNFEKLEKKNILQSLKKNKKPRDT